MKTGVKILSAVIAAALLSSCGASAPEYDFSDKELSHAMAVKESQLDGLSRQPDEKNVQQKISNIDEYLYKFDKGGGKTETLRLTTKDDVVYNIRIGGSDNVSSDYCLFGIHKGDSKDSAQSLGKAAFDEEGVWSNIGGIDTLTFGSEKGNNGLLVINFDAGGKVKNISYTKA